MSGNRLSHAEQARTVVERGRFGALGTLSVSHHGAPFGSKVLYGLTPVGEPVFVLSSLAAHTKNLAADRRASLLVTDICYTADPLSSARVVLMGELERVRGPEPLAAMREIILARHPEAAAYIDFGDFGYYRMEIERARFVGGFGRMSWLDAEAYRGAEPDPLWAISHEIISHMNDDHPDALETYCEAFAEMDVDDVVMVWLDEHGFEVEARVGEHTRSLRIPFKTLATTLHEARDALIARLKEARAILHPPPEPVEESVS